MQNLGPNYMKLVFEHHTDGGGKCSQQPKTILLTTVIPVLLFEGLGLSLTGEVTS